MNSTFIHSFMHAFISFQIKSKIAATNKDLSCQANLKNTSERLIKSIVDLRKKIYIVQEKLEHEVKVSVGFFKVMLGIELEVIWVRFNFFSASKKYLFTLFLVSFLQYTYIIYNIHTIYIYFTIYI